MNRQETVFRRIAYGYVRGERSFTQLGVSKELGVSLSIVNSAVRNLSEINAVRVKARSFEIMALDRLLLYWATHRNLGKDVVYQTRAEMPVRGIEQSMPNQIAFTGYTAYRYLYGDAPADYSEVYVYATQRGLEQIKDRFTPNEKVPNVTVLRCDGELENEIDRGVLKSSSVCPPQIFVDLWNMREWYAKDFVDALSKRLKI